MLLATDSSKSTLRASFASGQHALVYSCYGHHEKFAALPGWPCFSGERMDSTTGYYALGNGYRAYNPVLMRFNHPDNLSPFGEGGLNAYAYCAGDPVNRSDPTGHTRLPGLLTVPRQPVPSLKVFAATAISNNIDRIGTVNATKSLPKSLSKELGVIATFDDYMESMQAGFGRKARIHTARMRPVDEFDFFRGYPKPKFMESELFRDTDSHMQKYYDGPMPSFAFISHCWKGRWLGRGMRS